MHGPAPVSLDPAGDGGFWRGLVALVHALAALTLLAWQPGGWPTLAALGVAVAGAWAWRQCSPSGSSRRLAWDGQGWEFDGHAVTPAVALDLGGWMLLRLRRDGSGAYWLPLSPARAGSAWPALRTALYAAPVQAV